MKPGDVVCTVSETPVLCSSLPAVPIIVTEYVPSATAVVVLMVRVEVGLVLPDGVNDVGLRLHVTPLVTEEQVSATALLKPFNAPTVTVEVVELPGATVAGEAAVAEI